MIRNLCRALAIVAGLGGAVAQAGPVSLHGLTTVMNTLVLPHKPQIEAASGQAIVVVGNGSQRGLADLLAGKAQIAMISAPLEEEVKKINARQPGAIDPARLAVHPVGETRAAFVVHRSNPVRALPDSKIAAMLAGTIANWQEVGGPDQAVVVVAAQSGDGVRSSVEAKLLTGGDLTKDVRALSNAVQVVKVVAQLPGGLGLAAAVSVNASVAELKGDAAIAKPLILVTMGEVSPQVRKVIEAVAKVGQF